MAKEMENINIRIPPKLRKLIDRYLDIDTTYVNLSEFTRAALREKIDRGIPGLYKEMLRSEDPQSP